MSILMITFLISGFVLAILSVPLILGKIPPNGLYGFRVRKTMEHPEIWYPVNQHGGKCLFAASLCLIAASIALRLVPGIALETYSLAVLAVWVIVFSIAMFASIRYLNGY